MGKKWGYAATGTLSPEKVAAQGGKKKLRGFWNRPETLETLALFAAGTLSLAEAADLLETNKLAVLQYARAKTGFVPPKA